MLVCDSALVWHAPESDNTERKRLLVHLIEDATLTRKDYLVRLGMHLRGGNQWTLEPVEPPKPRAALIRCDACDATISELIELLTGGYDDISAAAELNRRGHRDSGGDRFTGSSVMDIRQKFRLPESISCQRQQLRERGYCTASDLWCPTWNQCKCGIQACAL